MKMKSLSPFILIGLAAVLVVCAKNDGNPQKKSLQKRKVSNVPYSHDFADRTGKELNKNWPFLPDHFPMPLGSSGASKPFGPYQFLRPKPVGDADGSNDSSPSSSLSPPVPIWGWLGDHGGGNGGWTSVGWISTTSQTCEVPSETITVTSTSTSVVTNTVSPTGSSDGGETETETEWVTSTSYTTQQTTSTSTVYETNTIETTSTQIETSTTVATYTVVNTNTPTTTVTVGHTVHPSTETIVLEPSVAAEYTTSKVTMYMTETPTLTTHTTKETTITTGLKVVTETVHSPLVTTPMPTVTEFIPTTTDVIVGTVTSTISTNQPQCTLTEYEYVSTVTTPTETFTATTCGMPCSPGEKCLPVCYPKTATKFVEVTSTSIVTASEPLVVTFSGTETKTEYEVTPTVLYTTTTLETTDETQEFTITATSTLSPVSIQTVTTDMILSSFPTTITTKENLCTITIFETCTSTTTLEPVLLTIYDTSVIEVDEIVTMLTTSFTAPPVPTTTSYVQGDIKTSTATVVKTVVTNTDPTTITLPGTTTVGSGTTTITPTATVVRIQTATFTSTPALSTTNIKKRTLKVEEHTTDVEETTAYYHVTPTSTCVEIVEVTPTPSIVIETNLLVAPTSSPTDGNSGPGWTTDNSSPGWTTGNSRPGWTMSRPNKFPIFSGKF